MTVLRFLVVLEALLGLFVFVSLFRRVGGDWKLLLFKIGVVQSGLGTLALTCSPSKSDSGGSLLGLDLHATVTNHRDPIFFIDL